MNEKIEVLNKRDRDVMEQYETVRLWINKKCDSLKSARYYIPNLMKFFELHNTNPDEIIRRWKEVRYDWKERRDD